MDHLQVPKGPIRGHIEVPLYCSDGYDNGTFLQYVDRLGWTRDEITNTSTTNRTIDEIHALLQRWCYFGIMHEIFGPIDMDDFTVPNAAGGRRICTTNLPRVVSSWLLQQAKIPANEKIKNGHHLLECFSSISNLFREMHSTPPDFQTRLDGRLLLSISILLEYLIEMGLNGPWNLLDPEECASVTENFMPGCRDLLLSRMKEDGWCSNEIRILAFNSSDSLLYFISNMDPPRPQNEHTISKCNSFRCKAYNIDVSAYETKHAVEGCNCPFVFASQSDLFEILRKGSIPLAETFGCTVEDSGQGQRRYVKLVDFKPQAKFVAISHVWSNGLGNQHDNGIPECQLDRISKLVSNLYGGNPTPFWLDTLSFPLAPAEAYDLALIRMRDSYEEADKVLVLDSYLLSQNLEAMSYDEVATRLMISPWSRRLWTLQEAVLGKTVALQFNDGYVELDHLLKSWATRTFQNRLQNAPALFDTGHFTIPWEFLQSLRYPYRDSATTSDIPEEGSVRETGAPNMMTAMRALAFRNTSVLADEVLCLSVLLNIDLHIILQIPPADRMMKIWSLQKNLYPSMVFWAGPKLEHTGFRWAAASLLQGQIHNPTSYQVERPCAKLLGSGLLIQYPGVVLSGLINPVPAFNFSDQTGGTYQVICLRQMKAAMSEQDCLTPSRIEDPTCFERLAIIMSRPLGNTARGERQSNSQAILVSVVKSMDGIIYVESLYTVSIVAIGCLEEHLQKEKELNEAWLCHWMTSPVVNQNLGENLGVEVQGNIDKTEPTSDSLIGDLDEPTEWFLSGRRTDDHQMWCVD
jgi:hypothetical protein